MFREEVSYPKGNRKENICFYAGLIAVILLVSALNSWLSKVGIRHMDLLAFAILAILAVFVLYQRVFRYRYESIGSDLIITRFYGDHEKKLQTLNLKEIQSIGKYNRSEKIPTVYACVWSRKLEKVQIIFRQNQKDARLVFQPSESFINRIEEYLHQENSHKAEKDTEKQTQQHSY